MEGARVVPGRGGLAWPVPQGLRLVSWPLSPGASPPPQCTLPLPMGRGSHLGRHWACAGWTAGLRPPGREGSLGNGSGEASRDSGAGEGFGLGHHQAPWRSSCRSAVEELLTLPPTACLSGRTCLLGHLGAPHQAGHPLPSSYPCSLTTLSPLLCSLFCSDSPRQPEPPPQLRPDSCGSEGSPAHRRPPQGS